MFGFGKPDPYPQIAVEFHDEFFKQFHASMTERTTALTNVFEFSGLEANHVFKVLSTPRAIQHFLVGIMAENVMAWPNLFGEKTERKFLNAVVLEGQKRYGQLMDNPALFYELMSAFRKTPMLSRAIILQHVLAGNGVLEKTMREFMDADPMAVLMAQSSIADGTLGILASMKDNIKARI